MFCVVGGLLSTFSILELSKQLKNNFVYIGLFLLMTVMLVFRYGQGTDYHDYEQMYNYIYINGDILSNTLAHGEFGWYVFMMLSKRLGLDFSDFIAVISLIMMSFTYKSIKRYSPNNIFSLLILYPTYYLTYYYSAIRQGLILSIFLYLGINYLLERKYVKYYLLIAILMQLHIASIILLAVPIGINLIKCNRVMFISLAILLSISLSFTGIFETIMNYIGKGYNNITISYLAIVLRIILYYIVYKLHIRTIALTKRKDEALLFNIYTLGFVFFLMFAFYATLSQRITMPLKAVEVLLIPIQVNLLKVIPDKITKIKKISIRISNNIKFLLSEFVLILILNIELIKNIYSYIEQGNYFKWITPITYPYISIFNKEDIFKYIDFFK